jgi:RimJ/RimL family protein N-acetyltransferase
VARPTPFLAEQNRLSMAQILAARPVEVLPHGLVRTQRMVLRPLRESDRAEYTRVLAASREHLRPWTGLYRENETDNQLFDRHIEMARIGDECGTAWRRIAVLNDGRKGLGSEGVGAMLDHALAELPGGLGLHRVQAAIMPANLASIRLARRVGLLRQPAARASIRIGGRWEFHELFVRSVIDQVLDEAC